MKVIVESYGIIVRGIRLYSIFSWSDPGEIVNRSLSHYGRKKQVVRCSTLERNVVYEEIVIGEKNKSWIHRKTTTLRTEIGRVSISISRHNISFWPYVPRVPDSELDPADARTCPTPTDRPTVRPETHVVLH